MDEDVLAVAQLKALAKVPGALRIITNEHACGGGMLGEDIAACEAFSEGTDENGRPLDLKNQRHFVLHDVVRIEGPNHRGQYTAYSDPKHRDYCEGRPAALLRRLTEWQRG